MFAVFLDILDNSIKSRLGSFLVPLCIYIHVGQSLDFEEMNLEIVLKTSRDHLPIQDSSRPSAEVSGSSSGKTAVREPHGAPPPAPRTNVTAYQVSDVTIDDVTPPLTGSQRTTTRNEQLPHFLVRAPLLQACLVKRLQLLLPATVRYDMALHQAFRTRHVRQTGNGGEVRHGVKSGVSRETSSNKHVTPHLHGE